MPPLLTLHEKTKVTTSANRERTAVAHVAVLTSNHEEALETLSYAQRKQSKCVVNDREDATQARTEHCQRHRGHSRHPQFTAFLGS